MTMHAMARSAWMVGALAVAGPAAAADMRMIMAWDESYSATVEIALPFARNVARVTEGRVSIKTFGPETVPPFEQLQPISVGVFDFIFTAGGYHTGSTAIASAMDGLTGDHTKRRETGVYEWVDNYYQQKFNVKLLSMPTAASGFQFMLKKPLDEDGNWKGRMIRGASAYGAIIKEMGGQSVILPAGEIYTSVEKGVVDGLGWPAVGSIGYRFHEVAPYIVRPTLGTVTFFIFANLNTFKRLSPADQKAILEYGEKLERDTTLRFDQLLEEETNAMLKQGARIIQAKKTKDDFQRMYAEAIWPNVFKQTPAKDGERFYEFAKSKGMAK